MQTAVTKANTKIRQHIQALDESPYRPPGSTVTLALIYGHLTHIANVGDSRTYAWREGRLTQITRDHSLAAELAAWLGSTSDADKLCWQLLAEANRRDGSDNISVIAVNINAQQDQQARERAARWSMTVAA
jgi:serine/threonine protein phosphatase PrpC